MPGRPGDVSDVAHAAEAVRLARTSVSIVERLEHRLRSWRLTLFARGQTSRESLPPRGSSDDSMRVHCRTGRLGATSMRRRLWPLWASPSRCSWPNWPTRTRMQTTPSSAVLLASLRRSWTHRSGRSPQDISEKIAPATIQPSSIGLRAMYFGLRDRKKATCATGGREGARTRPNPSEDVQLFSSGPYLPDVGFCVRTEPSMDHSNGGNGQRKRHPTMSEQFICMLVSWSY